MDFCDVVRFSPKDAACANSLGFASLISLSSLKAIEGNSHKNRSYVESGKYRLILDPHQDVKKDFIHHRNCGFNHVVAKLAAEKQVAFGFSLAKLHTPQQMGRVMQAIKLCRKYNVTMVLCTGAKDPCGLRRVYDLAAFGHLLGMHPSEAKQALFLAQRL